MKPVMNGVSDISSDVKRCCVVDSPVCSFQIYHLHTHDIFKNFGEKARYNNIRCFIVSFLWAVAVDMLRNQCNTLSKPSRPPALSAITINACSVSTAPALQPSHIIHETLQVADAVNSGFTICSYTITHELYAMSRTQCSKWP